LGLCKMGGKKLISVTFGFVGGKPLQLSVARTSWAGRQAETSTPLRQNHQLPVSGASRRGLWPQSRRQFWSRSSAVAWCMGGRASATTLDFDSIAAAGLLRDTSSDFTHFPSGTARFRPPVLLVSLLRKVPNRPACTENRHSLRKMPTEVAKCTAR